MINEAVRIIRIMLGEVSSVTREEIIEAVNEIIKMTKFSSLNENQLTREIESIYSVRVEEFRIIESDERRLPWLNEKKTQISWEFWSRYRQYLQDTKNFAIDTLNKLDRLTDRILDGLYDPTRAIEISKRGLVVGQVQSGKTSNYTGLICKAADAGFKLIIILAGIHNNLRSQTQLRIDEGFLGFDTQHTRAFHADIRNIGVGLTNLPGIAHSLTSSLNDGDFTQGAARAFGINFDTNDPIIAIVKKNSSILERLFQWLSVNATNENGRRVIRNKALLLIDDEADYASINISNDPDQRSSINRWITQILDLFGKSSYIGYTATPFANIFIPIEADELFPRDFIVNIPAPSNYIGPEKIFGFEMKDDESMSPSLLPIIHRITDYSETIPDNHNIRAQLPLTIPDSLKKAIRCFILTCAIRRVRGQVSSHNSMLIHVSRFQIWQERLTELVQECFDYYRLGIDQNDQGVIEDFRRTYEVDNENYKSYVTTSKLILSSELREVDANIMVHEWDEVNSELNAAVSRIVVRSIHGGSRDVLDYYDNKGGLSVIAIGGNKLSRGLTLEGLSISYFLRSSRMYDTLMQMGRWFGYRSGYVDLCRLFTSREINEWFCHITHASEELREEFDYMADVAGASPEQYALRVRTHPGVLQISATNKLRSATTVQITWAGRLVESYEFKKDEMIIDSNFSAAREFIASLTSDYSKPQNCFLWKNVSADRIMNFLNQIRTPENLKAYDPQNLIRFIRMQLPNNELTAWRVAFMNKKNAHEVRTFIIDGKDTDIGCYLRNEDENNSDDNVYYLRKSHIISPKDEFIDLTEEEYNTALDLTIARYENQKKDNVPKYPSGEIVRNMIRDPREPLLLIYLLDPAGGRMLGNCEPFLGYAISFPKSNHNSNVAYAVNEQLLDRFNIDDSHMDYEYEED